jgi:PhnB protein
MAPQPTPEGYHTVTPYLAVDDAARAIEHYGKAFGAKKLGRTSVEHVDAVFKRAVDAGATVTMEVADQF